MDALIIALFFAPLLLLIWAMVRYAGRIRREAIDKDLRNQHLEHVNQSLATFVLERDRHTCRRCGSTEQVGIDLKGETPAEGVRITADDLEARCGSCFQRQWKTLQDQTASRDERNGILPRFW